MKSGAGLLLLFALSLLPEGEAADSSGPAPSVLRGTVKVVDPPRRRKIRMDAHPDAAAMHDGPAYAEDIVVDAENRVQWAFVYVKSGLEGKTFPAPKEAKLLVHDKCLQKPPVLGLQGRPPAGARRERSRTSTGA